MKRSNPALLKPPLTHINSNLTAYKCDKKSKNKFITTCRGCGEEFEFYEKDLKDQIYKCPHCGKEEIFFRWNFG